MSDHQINNNEQQQTQDMNIDNIDDNEDLDAFLVLLESRLRADFTSPDLSRIISSQGTSSSSANRGGGTALLSTLPSGNPSSPTKFIRLIYKVFTKAGKPIKLRSILSVLGLDDDATIERDAIKNSSNNGISSFATTTNFNKDDSNELQDRKTDEVVYRLLTKAEEDDEKWVRVIAGIIKRIMFSKPSDASSTTTKEMSNEKKESESDKQLRKIITNILSSINKTAIQAEQLYNEAKLKLYKQIDEESTDEIEVQQKQSAATNTLSTYLIGSDLYPTYVPLRYTLLPPSTIKSIIPNVNTNVHFTSNMNANVLKVDAEVDAKRAEEEGKEMLSVQQKQQVSAAAATNGIGAGGRGSRATNQTGGGAVLAGRMRGRFSNTAGRGSTTTSGSSLFRPSTTGRGSAAAGRMGTVGGRAGRISGRGGGRLGVGRTGGRVGSLARLTGGRGTATGRGSKSAPLQRRVPGAARAILNSTSGRGRGGGMVSGKASCGGGGEKTKMKMIDASEVEGLTRQANEKEKTSNMTSVQARKLERKRKLMETAKASGLRGREKKIAKTEAGEAATGNAQATKSSTSGDGTDTSQNKSTNVTAAAASQQIQSQQQPPSAAYVSLLEKSNKLTPEDRQTILLFFQNRNPVQPGLRPPSLSLPPGADESTGIFKVKINEDKKFDESTNENVKETLYLELNYKTLGFKKTRKVKRK